MPRVLMLTPAMISIVQGSQSVWLWKCKLAISRLNQQTLRRYTSNSKAHVIFSGIQPTGVPHLGNYLGALQQWVQLQNKASPSTHLLYSIVDLHAITSNQDADQLRGWKRETLATLLAIGLDPERSTIFYQSAVWIMDGTDTRQKTCAEDRQVPEHTELMWILSCTASVGYLSRMTQWKVCHKLGQIYLKVICSNWTDFLQSKLALSDDISALETTSAKAKLKLGLFSYPVLQAADILLYG